MEKSSDEKPIYTPPTREALVKTMFSDGIYVAKCKKCGDKIRGQNLKELREHKCRD